MYLSPVGATYADKTPKGAPDPVAVWARIKDRLREKLGVYKHPDGRMALIEGRPYPLLTTSGALALKTALSAFAKDVIAQMQAAGKDSWPVTKASSEMTNKYVNWYLATEQKYGTQKFDGKYLYAPPVRDLFDIFDRFMINVSAAQWAGYNIESSYERMLQALDETTGGWLLKWPIEAGYKTAEWIDKGLPGLPTIPDFTWIAQVIKWGSIGGGLFLLYRYVLQPSDKKS